MGRSKRWLFILTINTRSRQGTPCESYKIFTRYERYRKLLSVVRSNPVIYQWRDSTNILMLERVIVARSIRNIGRNRDGNGHLDCCNICNILESVVTPLFCNLTGLQHFRCYNFALCSSLLGFLVKVLRVSFNLATELPSVDSEGCTELEEDRVFPSGLLFK